MTGFSTMPALADTFACEGMREHGLINRVIDDVFPGRDERAAEREARREQRRKERDERQRQKKEDEGWLKRTWKKVFKKK